MKNYGYYLIIIWGFIYSQNFHYSEDDWYILKKPGAINAIVEDNFNLHFATENGIFCFTPIENQDYSECSRYKIITESNNILE